MKTKREQITTGTDIGIRHPDGGYADTGNVLEVNGEWVMYSSEQDGDLHEAHISRVVVA
jgi:hypothetical protein